MILRDPVHGLVSFEAPDQIIVEQLLAAREVQRLRRIRQLGLTSFAYPGADHTRFSHALGAAHVMSRFIERMRRLHAELPLEQQLTADRSRDLLAAALLHDVGHGPFSHLFEVAAPGQVAHESWSERVIVDPETDVHRILTANDPGMPKRVCDLIRGRHELPYLAQAVSGTFDVDRCDYLLRDAYFTGVSYGRFDLDWLLRSFCLLDGPKPGGAPVLAIDGQKGLPAIESFILARLFMFQQVYFHKASRSSEWLLGRLFTRLAEISHPTGPRVEQIPRGLADILAHGETSLQRYLELDDTNVWTAISGLCHHADPILRDLATRLDRRRLFKSHELFGDLANATSRNACLEVAQQVAKQRGFDPKYYVGLDVPTVVAFDDGPEPLKVVFSDGRCDLPANVSFLLGRLHNEVLTRPRLIFADELRPHITAAIEAQFGSGGNDVRPQFAGGRFEERTAHGHGSPA
jgi:uncharacterized protein